MQITELKQGEKYEQEKQQRQMKPAPQGQFDRLASNRMSKPTPPFETPSASSALTAPELPLQLRQKNGLSTPPPDQPNGGNGTNGVPTPQHAKTKFVPKALPGNVPLKFGREQASDLQLLTAEEQDICRVLRIMPKPYLTIKENLLREAIKQGGALKKKAAKDIGKIDERKMGQIFDFFVHSGWIARA